MCAKRKQSFLSKNCVLLLQVYYISLHYLSVTALSLKETLFLMGWQWSPCVYEHLSTSVALIAWWSKAVAFYNHFSFFFFSIATEYKGERGWSPDYLHQAHMCLFLSPGPYRDNQLCWYKIEKELVSVRTLPLEQWLFVQGRTWICPFQSLCEKQNFKSVFVSNVFIALSSSIADRSQSSRSIWIIPLINMF